MNAEKTIGENGDVRPAHPIITGEVQSQAIELPWRVTEYIEIADAAAIAIEETINRDVELARDGGEHWSASEPQADENVEGSESC